MKKDKKKDDRLKEEKLKKAKKKKDKLKKKKKKIKKKNEEKCKKEAKQQLRFGLYDDIVDTECGYYCLGMIFSSYDDAFDFRRASLFDGMF